MILSPHFWGAVSATAAIVLGWLIIRGLRRLPIHRPSANGEAKAAAEKLAAEIRAAIAANGEMRAMRDKLTELERADTTHVLEISDLRRWVKDVDLRVETMARRRAT